LLVQVEVLEPVADLAGRHAHDVVLRSAGGADTGRDRAPNEIGDAAAVLAAAPGDVLVERRRLGSAFRRRALGLLVRVVAHRPRLPQSKTPGRTVPAKTDRVDGAAPCPAEPVAGGFGNPPTVPAKTDRVGGAGLCPPQPVARGFGNPPTVPAKTDRVGGAGLCPAEPVAPGFGNPPTVPAKTDRVDGGELCSPQPVTPGFGNPPTVPAKTDRVGGAGLCPAEPVAGGFGNPPRVPDCMMHGCPAARAS